MFFGGIWLEFNDKLWPDRVKDVNEIQNEELMHFVWLVRRRRLTVSKQ